MNASCGSFVGQALNIYVGVCGPSFPADSGQVPAGLAALSRTAIKLTMGVVGCFIFLKQCIFKGGW